MISGLDSAESFAKENGAPFELTVFMTRHGKFRATVVSEAGRGCEVAPTIDEAITAAIAKHEPNPT